MTLLKKKQRHIYIFLPSFENGGISIEEAPGIRNYGKFSMYLAYLRDPTGNKLCASLLIK